MKKRAKTVLPTRTESLLPDYDSVLSGVVDLLEAARRASARAINTVMTMTYWEIGRRIVEYEQGGQGRAIYGSRLLERLSADLTAKYRRGFSADNLETMRKFYRAYTPGTISETLSRKSRSVEKSRSAQSAQTTPRPSFPLPWSHYVRLLKLESSEARQFYESEALRGGWTVRQLDRQIATKFYERTLLSRNKSAMLKKGAVEQPEDIVRVDEEIKDPLVLEFLGLKDEYSESDLEEALIRHLESFLLELGGDFAFIGRQRRLRIGDEWFRIDLLFFHRRLRCLIIIDLKLGKFTHADAGQMHVYLNYAREHWTHEHENPPVGLILCAQRDNALAHYALEGLHNKVLAAEYRMALPDEAILAAELERSRRLLESRAASNRKRGRK